MRCGSSASFAIDVADVDAASARPSIEDATAVIARRFVVVVVAFARR
jgi:hypothetical protein